MSINTITPDNIFRKHKNNCLLLNTLWQRGDVWNKEQQENFIGSLMDGLIPQPITFNETPDGHWHSIDGKQRCNAILKFRDNLINYEGKKYKDLSFSVKRKFNTLKLVVYTYENITLKRIMRIFIATQQGSPLQPGEMINSYREPVQCLLNNKFITAVEEEDNALFYLLEIFKLSNKRNVFFKRKEYLKYFWIMWISFTFISKKIRTDFLKKNTAIDDITIIQTFMNCDEFISFQISAEFEDEYLKFYRCIEKFIQIIEVMEIDQPDIINFFTKNNKIKNWLPIFYSICKNDRPIEEEVDRVGTFLNKLNQFRRNCCVDNPYLIKIFKTWEQTKKEKISKKSIKIMSRQIDKIIAAS